MTEQDIRERLKICFGTNLKSICWIKRFTPDAIKFTITVSFNIEKERKCFELEEVELPRRGDLEKWFDENIATSLVEKIMAYQGPIRFLNLRVRCKLRGCQAYTDTPTEAKRRE